MKFWFKIEDENENNRNELNIEENVERSKIGNVQIENNKVKDNEGQIMKFHLQHLHVQRKI